MPRRPRFLLLPVLLFLPCVALSGCDESAQVPPPAYETAYQPIIGGTDDLGHPAVGAVLTDASMCTGTLISPRIVVTAAHCGGLGYTPKWFVLGGNVNYPDTTLYAQKWIPHPNFGEQVVDNYVIQVHDIAVVVLTDPAPVAPMKYRTSSLAGQEGSSITFVGYGQSSVYNPNSSGTKKKVTSSIGDVNSQGFWNFTNPSNPKNTCVGDSGGPALFSNGGTEEVVSVVSSGDENCTQNGWNTRVDIHASWLQGLIDTYDPGGVTAECGNGYCEVGETQANCPADCKESQEGGLGAPCNAVSDCKSGMVCVQADTGNFCTQYCADPNGGTGCPSPYTCVPLSQPPPSGEGVCYDLGSTTVCGNGQCEAGETSQNCAQDCGGGGGCGTITYEGCCAGNTLKYCDGTQLEELDCAGNPSCGWNGQAGFYDCGTNGGSDPSGTYAMSCGGTTAPICGDGKCEGTETKYNCPADCGPAGPVCGDGKCEGSETPNNCPADCKAPDVVCGDGNCQAPETSESCPPDCDITGAVCGDGKCEAPETPSSCPPDCNPGNLPDCGNGYCEQGETPSKCPGDCGGANPPECGNGYCEVGENATVCTQDCGGVVCGDGKCEAPETSESCKPDCDITGSVCGDGKCEAPETSQSCAQDCNITGPVCGDQFCAEDESCLDCPEDCGVCFDLDGDGKSETGCTAVGRSSTPAALVLLALILFLAAWRLSFRNRSRR